MTYIMLITSGLHWWQLAGKTNVCSCIGANGSPCILLASTTTSRKAFTPNLKLVLIYLTPRGVKAE